MCVVSFSRNIIIQTFATIAAMNKSNFIGVFTLKTQEEVQQLAFAVQKLVERSVDVFVLMAEGKASELRGYMETITRVAPSFIDLTVDEAEKRRAQAVLDSLTQTYVSLSRHLVSHPT